MNRIGDFIRASLAVKGKGMSGLYGEFKEGIYLRKRPDTVTIDLLDANNLAKWKSNKNMKIEPSMLHRCWLHRATLAPEQEEFELTKEEVEALRRAIR